MRLHDSMNRAQQIVIDEYVPTYPTTLHGTVLDHTALSHVPVFAKPNGEIWPLLLEKAMAKLMGSYRSLHGGWMCAAFRALTGSDQQEQWIFSGSSWSQHVLETGSMVSTTRGATEVSHEQLWHRMSRYLNSLNFLACCARMYPSSAGVKRANGLVSGHAYSLLAFIDCGVVRLVKLRNPWGAGGAWKGAWSDSSRNWRSEQHKQVAEMVQLKRGDDGVFFMSFEDWCERFTHIDVSLKSMRAGQPEALSTTTSEALPMTSRTARAVPRPLRAEFPPSPDADREFEAAIKASMVEANATKDKHLQAAMRQSREQPCRAKRLRADDWAPQPGAMSEENELCIRKMIAADSDATWQI